MLFLILIDELIDGGLQRESREAVPIGHGFREAEGGRAGGRGIGVAVPALGGEPANQQRRRRRHGPAGRRGYGRAQQQLCPAQQPPPGDYGLRPFQGTLPLPPPTPHGIGSN